jgi:hypothetical protein
MLSTYTVPVFLSQKEFCLPCHFQSRKSRLAHNAAYNHDLPNARYDSDKQCTVICLGAELAIQQSLNLHQVARLYKITKPNSPHKEKPATIVVHFCSAKWIYYRRLPSVQSVDITPLCGSSQGKTK